MYHRMSLNSSGTSCCVAPSTVLIAPTKVIRLAIALRPHRAVPRVRAILQLTPNDLGQFRVFVVKYFTHQAKGFIGGTGRFHRSTDILEYTFKSEQNWSSPRERSKSSSGGDMDERRPEGGRSSPIPQPRTSEWVENTCRKRSHSLKVFGTAMVSAWRKRGEEIQHLEKETQHFKHQYVQNKSTVRVCKAMMQVEHERNGDLHLELKMSKRSSDEVQTSILNLTEDKEKLLQEVESSKREHDELQVEANQRKIELCAALIEQSIDKGRLSQDEEAITLLRRQNVELVTEVATLRRMQMEYKMCEQRLTKELEVANARMNTMQEELNHLQVIIRGWNSSEPQENEPQKHPMIDVHELAISNDSLQKDQPLQVLENAFIYFLNILSWALVRFRF